MRHEEQDSGQEQEQEQERAGGAGRSRHSRHRGGAGGGEGGRKKSHRSCLGIGRGVQCGVRAWCGSSCLIY
jgi:hypothetical protein